MHAVLDVFRVEIINRNVPLVQFLFGEKMLVQITAGHMVPEIVKHAGERRHAGSFNADKEVFHTFLLSGYPLLSHRNDSCQSPLSHR